jgi:DNA-directed RNA polymerase subunit RPC12/RpoP
MAEKIKRAERKSYLCSKCGRKFTGYAGSTAEADYTFHESACQGKRTANPAEPERPEEPEEESEED